eukprot:gnl/MRDRNA2_/MRDRNA2_63398_c0_seq1.p1 gnl/MRDRNA2_/MRDRNA2_63398_c0~~gnl/MRDRNA2_/MRDRNA2_63398_c0_seq1.p1  ORF type:complete len:600 (+),score=88.93 gnl/MRDRNA2_/MRDRNA2_63398_c0_seq1:120-1919(+)
MSSALLALFLVRHARSVQLDFQSDYNMSQLTSESLSGMPSGGKPDDSNYDLDVDFLSNVTCKGPQYNISCEFKNIYWEAATSKWWLFILPGTELPDLKELRFNSKFGYAAGIQVKHFPNAAAMNQFVREIRDHTTKYEGLSLIYDSIWHNNIGHALWDGLYPAYTALVQLGMPFAKYRSVAILPGDCKDETQPDGKCMSEGVFRTFGGGEWMPWYQDSLKHGWHHFAHAVAGSGRKGARIFNRDLALNGARELSAAWLFRQRMYQSHGLQPPVARTLSAANRTGRLQGIIVDNKRYSPPFKSMLQTWMKNPKGTEGGTIDLQLHYIDYGAHRNFTEHLRILRDVAVHVSAAGTGQCYAPLLPDGSVHVNLGNNGWPSFIHDKAEPWEKFGVSFMEEYWAEGIPYIRALYYPVKTAHLGIRLNETVMLVQQASDLILSNFSMPVEPGKNLSPVGKTFKEYCYQDDHACEWMLGILNGVFHNGTEPGKESGDWVECFMDAWPELVVMEVGVFNDDEANPGRRCNLRNQDLLQKLRKKYLGALDDFPKPGSAPAVKPGSLYEDSHNIGITYNGAPVSAGRLMRHHAITITDTLDYWAEDPEN